ncbi:dihydrofolate reductase family protein [Leifsonia aquatica]|uniref:dihydrofolate reductase family protein n=1 Tax=Leifsonia aquatica TaxID=144185 RepID=UPI000469C4DC|nr:dihydrofolate reductase family protein [Leifsonia aquatica]
MAVRVDLNISLDGVAVPEDPMGAEWGRLVEHYTATRTFRERVFHDTSGAGTTGVDDRYAAAYFDGIGAEVMGAGMFGLHAHPDDPDWRGWWGDEPPFGYPLLVLTHRERAPIEFDNGTRFEFMATTPEAALERARELAGDADVRIGGGASLVRDYLAAGLVDRLHVAVAPIIIGAGARLWDGLSDLDLGYTVTSEIAESGVVHVTYTR